MSTSRTRRTLRWTRRLLLTLLLPLLLLAAFGQWWVLPRLNDYRDDLASALGDALHLPVRIEAVTATLDGGRLALALRGVSLDDPGRQDTLAYFKQAAITLNLWRSLQEWRPVVGRIRLEGASVTLEPGPDGLSRFFAPASVPPDENKPALTTAVAHPLFDLRQLDLVGEQVTLRRSDGFAWQLLQPYLRLQDAAGGRRLALTADLPTPPGGRLELTVERSPLDDQGTAERGWRLRGQIQAAAGATEVHSPTEFEATQTSAGWQAIVRNLRAEYLLAWAMPWLSETARQWLNPLNPRGHLPEITLSADPVAGTYQLAVALQGFSVDSTHGLPGFDNVTGRLTFTPGQGQVALNCRTVQVDTAGLLRAPIILNTLNGTVAWRRSPEGLHLDSAGLELANADLNGRFWGSVIVPDHGGPALDIQGHYHDVQVKQAWRYLPVAVIPPQGVAWLDRALVDGRVATGELIFRGPPAAFPFDRDEGLFETRFQVENAVLDYAPGWPRLERLQAEVRFRNRGLTVEARSGQLLDGRLEEATTRIADLSKVVVEVQGRAKGPGASMWQALRDSPVGRELHEDLPDLQIGGVSTLDLALTLPTDGRPGQVRGRVGLLDNDVTLPARKVALDRLRGTAHFTETSLEIRDVQALWRDAPIRLDLELADRELRTQIAGKLGLAALAGPSAAAALKSQITGVSDWKAALVVPTHRREQESAFSLELRSDLRGVAINLPAPLGKTAGESRPLRITVRPVERDRSVVALDYAPETQALVELAGLLDTPRFERGELRIGAGPARLPDKRGLAIVADLPRWTWAAPVDRSSPGQNGEGSAGCRRASGASSDADLNPLAVVSHLEARIGQWVVAGQSFDGVTIRAHRDPQGLQVALDSEALAGQATVPDRPTPARPLNIALQRLWIQRATDDGNRASRVKPTAAANPCQLPPLTLTAADLRLNDQALGRLRLAITPRFNGVRLSGIELRSAQQQIDADGEWWWNGDRQASRITAEFRSPALGDTLAVFGYPESGIARGPTKARLDAEWAAGLPDFALERISGTLGFEIGPGQLLEINPGLGRMLGLFSVQNLSRRLSLDFSDLFQPGTSFDRISGEFVFKNGQARTDNLNIDAPAAQIEIRGRVGLRDRDYDQHITVTPQLGVALPVAGAIVGGPAAGAAVFVAERLLQKGIEQATQYQYRLTGSWDDPVLEPRQIPAETSPEPIRHGFASDN
ncbi:MAG: TIGR02099 family protein [Candidatus Competibacteraceae bacterium]|nr:TIGR02099 family protein [Candidatus Competibacteraceae bacterium]MCB1820586.1 TIGR02099 family protein [Candidatus Competibacteraceae bacterium]